MKGTMKAARLHKIGEPLRIDCIKIPKLGNSDVLIAIRASGICHSDINYRDHVSPVGRMPIVLGHEIAGTIAEVGNCVEGIREGERVCVHYILSCCHCTYCNTGKENLCKEYRMIGKDVDGGFAEYISVPARNVLKLPEAIPFEQGAIIGCAVSTAFHALNRGKIGCGDTVLIYGVGGVGVHAVQLAAKTFGAGKVIAMDISDEKLKLAKKLGADEIVNVANSDPVKRTKEITDGKLADVVLEFIGLRKTIQEAIECVGKGGRMVMVGIGSEDITISPYKTMIGKEITLGGSNDHLKSEMVQLTRLVGAGRIDLSSSVTHKLPLEDINRGFEILEKKIGNPLRAVIVQ